MFGPEKVQIKSKPQVHSPFKPTFNRFGLQTSMNNKNTFLAYFLSMAINVCYGSSIA